MTSCGFFFAKFESLDAILVKSVVISLTEPHPFALCGFSSSYYEPITCLHWKSTIASLRFKPESYVHLSKSAVADSDKCNSALDVYSGQSYQTGNNIHILT